MKNLFSLLFFLFIATTLNAQHFSFGVESGVASSINSNYSIGDFENRRNTYYSGLNATYHFNQKVSATTGFHYLRQGYKHPTCYEFEEGVKNALTGKVDYLIIPVLLDLYFGKTKKLQTSLGIYGGYNIKAVQDYPEPIGGCKIYYSPDLSGTTTDFSFGGIVGVGYKVFENDKFQITPMFKYYQGISNTFPKMEYIKIEKRYSSALLTLNLNYKIAR